MHRIVLHRQAASSWPCPEEAIGGIFEFKIHKCLKKVNDNRGALAALEKIPSSRSENFDCDGKIMRSQRRSETGDSRVSSGSFDDPRAVGALLRLQHLGVSKNDVSKFLSSHHND